MKVHFLAAAVALALTPMAASAVPAVSVSGASLNNGTNTADVFAAGYNGTTPLGATWLTANPLVTPPPSSLANIYKSPFEGTTTVPTKGSDGPTYFSSGGFTATDGAGSPSLLSFSTSQSRFTMLWGSIDTYNEITFFANDDGTGTSFTYNGTSAAAAVNAFRAPAAAATANANGNYDLVGLFTFDFAGSSTLSSFRSVLFRSERGVIGGSPTDTDVPALEFALAPIPGPLGILLIGTAFAGAAAVFGRRRPA